MVVVTEKGFVKCTRCRSQGQLCQCGGAFHSAMWPGHPSLDTPTTPCPDCSELRKSARPDQKLES